MGTPSKGQAHPNIDVDSLGPRCARVPGIPAAQVHSGAGHNLASGRFTRVPGMHGSQSRQQLRRERQARHARTKPMSQLRPTTAKLLARPVHPGRAWVDELSGHVMCPGCK